MTIEISQKELSGRVIVLSLSGRLTAVTAPEVRSRIKTALSAGYVDLILDLKEVAFMDSSGLSAIVSGFKQVREAGGSFKLAEPKAEVQSVFRLTMMDRIFEIYATAEEALESLKK